MMIHVALSDGTHINFPDGAGPVMTRFGYAQETAGAARYSLGRSLTISVAFGRWTYQAVASKDLYGIAEISNAKASAATTPNAVFKYAVGVDKRLREGLWLEMRVGKSRTADGSGQQTTALMAVTWSGESGLARR